MSTFICLNGGPGSRFFTPGAQDPTDYIYTADPSGESLVPFVLCRYQVPNDLFPSVSDDLSQVSPLIEQIVHVQAVHGLFSLYGAIIRDPFFATLPVPEEGSYGCYEPIPDYTELYDYADCSSDLGITVWQEPAAG